jgi:acetamidase/formamidase
MRDAFRKMRHFPMTTQGLNEDEAVSISSVAVDFGVAQLVDGNWGVHAIVKKNLFPEVQPTAGTTAPRRGMPPRRIPQSG